LLLLGIFVVGLFPGFDVGLFLDGFDVGLFLDGFDVGLFPGFDIVFIYYNNFNKPIKII
jgi:hypothetical protein